jgi:hypothetical protein
MNNTRLNESYNSEHTYYVYKYTGVCTGCIFILFGCICFTGIFVIILKCTSRNTEIYIDRYDTNSTDTHHSETSLDLSKPCSECDDGSNP